MHPDHLDDGRIQALLDGEVPPGEAASARAHAAGCPECSRRLEDAGEEGRLVSALLARLDSPTPRVEVGDIVASAAGTPSREVRDRRPWSRWAAAVLLALGVGGVAYAIPGSPVRQWVDDLIPKVFVRWARPGAGPSGTDNPSASLGGIAVKPGPTFLISFPRASGGVARISLGDGELVVVRAPAGAASYESAHNRLVVHAAAPAIFEIEIPRSATRLEIRVAGARIFLKEGARSEPDLSGSSRTLRLGPPSK
ncbi:MAG TPA: zf-HC2 domain-containing protein [Candidatus Eisenbacteria bacterium]|nr:zf-HC2 domain-containing protein [Candidatus Eisenbacteria bacterium]